MEQRTQAHGWHGHFLGFRARLNVEQMPVVPAWIVRSNLDDPRKIPYLLVWKDERACHGSASRLSDGEIKETVRLTCHEDSYADSPNGYVELKRTDGSITSLRIVWRVLPRNGGRALFLLCPRCDSPRRYVYGWEWDRFSGRSNVVRRTAWCCRSCNQLRYSSEGGYLRPGKMFRAFGNLPRPEPWLPYVFTSPRDAAEVGFCTLR